MTALRDRLRQAVQAGSFAAGEHDVLIAGDFNASRYDTNVESFWTGWDSTGYRFTTLSPTNGVDYPGTRLAGVPLLPRSQIDYLLASESLVASLVQPVAAVHLELLPTNFHDFRALYSDHLPVTVRVRVQPDNDP
jgi:endonuclease/exonuclease/phosphatase family metal-dependent hydrolase